MVDYVGANRRNQDELLVMHEVIEQFDKALLTTMAVNTAATLTRTAPRDTGWMRNNFTPWLAVPPAPTPAPRPKDPDVAATQGAVEGARNISRGRQVLSGVGYRPGFPTGVSNNVPYVLHVGASREDDTNVGFRGEGNERREFYRAPATWLEDGIRNSINETERQFELVARRVTVAGSVRGLTGENL